jgi:cell division initiation protein
MEVVPVKMTSLDIRKQEFKRVFRGLDPEEVMAFLETIADAFEELNRERLQALEREANLQEKVERYTQMEATLHEMLKTAQLAADDVRENARTEGRLIVKEAKALGNRAVEKARSHVRQMRNELVNLKSRRDMFIARFQSLLQAQSDFLVQLSGDEFDGVDDARTNDGDEKSYVKDGNGQIPNGENTETKD